MKISVITLPSKQYLAVGEGSLSNSAQWPIGQELKDQHFLAGAQKQFKHELRKRLKWLREKVIRIPRNCARWPVVGFLALKIERASWEKADPRFWGD